MPLAGAGAGGGSGADIGDRTAGGGALRLPGGLIEDLAGPVEAGAGRGCRGLAGRLRKGLRISWHLGWNGLESRSRHTASLARISHKPIAKSRRIWHNCVSTQAVTDQTKRLSL
jgi:hypothetical protein